MTIRQAPIRDLHFSLNNQQLIFTWIGLLLWAVAVGGCGDSSATLPVHGKVSYRGEPIANGSVTFFPPSGRSQSAPLSEAGEYEIDLAPGEYLVTVNLGHSLPPGWKEGDPFPPPKIVLPLKYTTQAKTPLKASVTPEGPESIDFAVE